VKLHINIFKKRVVKLSAIICKSNCFFKLINTNKCRNNAILIKYLKYSEVLWSWNQDSHKPRFIDQHDALRLYCENKSRSGLDSRKIRENSSKIPVGLC